MKMWGQQIRECEFGAHCSDRRTIARSGRKGHNNPTFRFLYQVFGFVYLREFRGEAAEGNAATTHQVFLFFVPA
jgi:hypothetical protein